MCVCPHGACPLRLSQSGPESSAGPLPDSSTGLSTAVLAVGAKPTPYLKSLCNILRCAAAWTCCTPLLALAKPVENVRLLLITSQNASGVVGEGPCDPSFCLFTQACHVLCGRGLYLVSPFALVAQGTIGARTILSRVFGFELCLCPRPPPPPPAFAVAQRCLSTAVPSDRRFHPLLASSLRKWHTWCPEKSLSNRPPCRVRYGPRTSSPTTVEGWDSLPRFAL